MNVYEDCNALLPHDIPFLGTMNAAAAPAQYSQCTYVAMRNVDQARTAALPEPCTMAPSSGQNESTTTFRHYLISRTICTTAFATAVSACYAWLLWGGRSHLPINIASHLPIDMIGTDLAMTPIWIALLSVLWSTNPIRTSFADGTVLFIANAHTSWVFRQLPRSVPARAVVAALLCALAITFPLLLVLPRVDGGSLSSSGAVLAKVGITIASSLLIVPLVVHAAAQDVVSAVSLRLALVTGAPIHAATADTPVVIASACA